ncbi:FecR family protein [Sulfurivirga caldicuralii]|uniref:FecR family protein n=1 Tax=Sulfurivirga caldicuralii TaxID=364032 RepID=A0A1N6H5C5_9GAMM|nr:FecR family protein [Sulfurivirga caldicuralii]SIO14953.1 FecR family protein [Sulfurivirga caldicuralii]
MRGWWIGCCMVLLLATRAWAADEVVGRVQLLIGQAVQAKTAAGTESVLHQGDAILEGMVLSTAAGTVAHLSMSDGAYISLRPDSTLQIQCYRAEPRPCIRLNLIRGEMRERTGAIGQAHKSRFRLNTPVAAVGIRGTDFVTRAYRNETLIRVIQGEVVAAPLGGACTAGGLGPCNTPLAASLAAGDHAILQVRRGEAARRILVSSERASLAHPPVHHNDDLTLADLSQNPERVAYFLAQHGLSPADGSGAGNGDDSLARYGDMVFATWTTAADGISLPYAQAQQQREVTVGNAEGALWRAQGPYRPPQGTVKFSLSKSEARVTTLAGRQVSALISHPQLQVDFVSSSMQTRFQAQRHDNGELTTVSASVPVSSVSGIFVGKTDAGGSIAGALSHDGRQAGYFVQQPWGQDRLDAKLLWQGR